LATLLTTIGSKASITSTTLICHSQGGQIARLMLESGTYSAVANPWFAKIKRVLFICTPHMGAPKALAEFVGLESVDLVSAANVQIGAKTWDSAYQLLPAPNAPGNPVILNDGTPQDFYQSNVAQILGLDSTKLANVAKKTFATLDFSKRPPGVQYTFVVGTGQETVEAIDIDSTQSPPYFAPITDDLGDGTVPIWSAAYTGGTGVPMKMPGDHVGIMNTNAFRTALYSYFGVSAALLALHPTKPTAVISLNKRGVSAWRTDVGADYTGRRDESDLGCIKHQAINRTKRSAGALRAEPRYSISGRAHKINQDVARCTYGSGWLSH